MDQDGTWHVGRPQLRRLCVRWGHSSPPQKGRSPLPNFRQISIMVKRLDASSQDATWYGGRLRPRRHCVKWGSSSPSPKRVGAPPQFSAHVYCGQTAGWIKMALSMDVDLGPGRIVLDGDPAPLPEKGTETPNFRPIFIVAKRLDASRCHLVWRLASARANLY